MGPQGPEGPQGPQGEPGLTSGLGGTYVWSPDPDLMGINQGEIRGDDPTLIQQQQQQQQPQLLTRGISADNELVIHQIDADGLSNDYFTVEPGEHLVIRDVINSGVIDLVVTNRESMGEHAMITYDVVSTTQTPVVGSRVRVALFATSPGSDVIVGPPGPAGPAGPKGDPGSGAYEEFVFSSATNTWTINHTGFESHPEVSTFDTTGRIEYDPEVTYPSATQVVVSWFYPTAGIARLMS